jgi:phytoene desaturase
MSVSTLAARVYTDGSMSVRVAVIGGGVGGLAAACRLAAIGCRVTLLEKNARVGGKLNRWQAPHPGRPAERPFLFDTGPSLLTLPFVFKDLFDVCGKDVRDYLQILPLCPVSRFVWRDGESFELHSDANQRHAELLRAFPQDVEGFDQLFEFGRHVWNLAGESFLSNSPEQMLRGDGTFDPMAGLRMLSVPFRIGMFGKFNRRVDRHVRSRRLREVLYQYATYSGASPFAAPATLSVIPFCELYFGGWYPKGGMYELAIALESLARDLGVDVRTDVAVRRILTRPDGKRARAVGVELADGSTIDADEVVCNSDVIWAYRHLIDPAHRPHFSDRKLDHIEPGGSGMVLLLGVEGTYPQLAHHTKFMPDDYQSDLRAMFQTRTIPQDPCIYVCATTRTDPTQAPPDCENLFVLCSAPPLDGTIDWASAGPAYERQIIETLEMRCGLTDLSKRIVVRRRITPADLASDYNANAGAIYGISSNGLRAAFLRPPNTDRKIAGLHFVGGSTHPGGGLPLVTLSGRIVASEIQNRHQLSEVVRRRFDVHEQFLPEGTI